MMEAKDNKERDVTISYESLAGEQGRIGLFTPDETKEDFYTEFFDQLGGHPSGTLLTMADLEASQLDLGPTSYMPKRKTLLGRGVKQLRVMAQQDKQKAKKKVEEEA